MELNLTEKSKEYQNTVEAQKLHRDQKLLNYQRSQINGEIQGVQITVEAHIYGEIQHN